MSVPRSAVIVPHLPASAASIACRPKRVASTRSKAVGVPPRWTWPSTVARVSLPVRRSISPSSQWAIPPRRTWPKASVRLVLGRPACRPSAGRPRRRRRSASTGSRSGGRRSRRPGRGRTGCSGIRITLAPPASPAWKAIQPAWRPITSTISDPVVALGGRVEAVDRLHRDVDRGVEAEGVVGGAEVVVDRLRHADHLDAGSSCSRDGGAERVLAADRDQAVDAVGLQVLGDPLGAAVLLERIGPRGAEDGAAARQDAAHLGDPERVGCRSRAGRASRRGSRRTRGRSRPTPLRTIARITAFSPGQSPPPVRTPIRIGSGLGAGREVRLTFSIVG